MKDLMEIRTDILNGIDDDKRTVILHGCNCMHTMGAGIALYLNRAYPKVLQADKLSPYSDSNKLGTYTTAVINDNLHILNCYTQYDYARHNQRPADYRAIEAVLKAVYIKYKDWHIRMPRIGCGLAGGDWGHVKQLVKANLLDANVTVYYV